MLSTLAATDTSLWNMAARRHAKSPLHKKKKSKKTKNRGLIAAKIEGWWRVKRKTINVPLKSAEIVGCCRKRWFDRILVLSSAVVEPHLSWFIFRSRALGTSGGLPHGLTLMLRLLRALLTMWNNHHPSPGMALLNRAVPHQPKLNQHSWHATSGENLARSDLGRHSRRRSWLTKQRN